MSYDKDKALGKYIVDAEMGATQLPEAKEKLSRLDFVSEVSGSMEFKETGEGGRSTFTITLEVSNPDSNTISQIHRELDNIGLHRHMIYPPNGDRVEYGMNDGKSDSA